MQFEKKLNHNDIGNNLYFLLSNHHIMGTFEKMSFDIIENVPNNTYQLSMHLKYNKYFDKNISIKGIFLYLKKEKRWCYLSVIDKTDVQSSHTIFLQFNINTIGEEVQQVFIKENIIYLIDTLSGKLKRVIFLSSDSFILINSNFQHQQRVNADGKIIIKDLNSIYCEFFLDKDKGYIEYYDNNIKTHLSLVGKSVDIQYGIGKLVQYLSNVLDKNPYISVYLNGIHYERRLEMFFINDIYHGLGTINLKFSLSNHLKNKEQLSYIGIDVLFNLNDDKNIAVEPDLTDSLLNDMQVFLSKEDNRKIIDILKTGKSKEEIIEQLKNLPVRISQKEGDKNE
jgi:hypothetical protein